MAIDMKYVKSGMGILKMFEILLALIAFICITVSKVGFEGDYKQQQQDYRYYDVLGAFDIFGIMVASFVYAVFCFKLCINYDVPWKILNVFLCIPVTLGCLITGIFMIAKVKHLYGSVLYKTDHGKWMSYTKCAAVAVVINFLVFVLFTIDIILHIRQIRVNEAEPERRPLRSRTPSRRVRRFLED